MAAAGDRCITMARSTIRSCLQSIGIWSGSLANSAYRIDHCAVIASIARSGFEFRARSGDAHDDPNTRSGSREAEKPRLQQKEWSAWKYRPAPDLIPLLPACA